MSHHNHAENVQNPGTWQVSATTKSTLLLFIGIGIAVAGLGFMTGQASRVWHNILLNYFYLLCLGLGGAFFVATQHLTSAMWSVPVRRVSESFMTVIPVVAVIGLVIYIFGGHSLYEWTHIEAMQNDPILAAKAGYLNPKFALIRFVAFFGLWIYFSRRLLGNSLAQDVTGDAGLTAKNYKLSAIFLPIFALSFSFMSFDMLMSLEPHWSTTMFAVHCFAGLFYSTLAAMTIVAVLLKRRGLLPLFNENHSHDLGKLMFAFAVFWAYIMFSQFMLIWYANLPEETVYYLKRFEGAWFYMCIALLIVKFIIPFFFLLKRDWKRDPNYIFKMAAFMLGAHWLDNYILVMPNYSPSHPVFGWLEVGIALGFFGLFAFVITSFLGKVPTMAFRDPRISETMHHHQ